MIICVADNVWNIVVINFHLASINPVLNELCRILSMIGNFFHFSQLLLESLDMIILIPDFRVFCLLISMQSVILSFLDTHQSLRAFPFAARLEDMNTTALDGCKNI